MMSITVRSEKDDKRIPIALASDVMFDVQLLLTHIGESLISDELGLYGRPAEVLAERFTLYIDPESGGISFKASAGKGASALMDRATALLKATLEKAGPGTYWIEDLFKDPRYRCIVLYDLMQLSKHFAPENGYSMVLGTDGGEKKFAPVDPEKAQAFLDGNGRISKTAVAGVLHGARSKRNIPMYSFAAGDDRAKVSFLSRDAESDASKYVNGAVVLKGVAKYSGNGELLDVSGIESVEPFTKRLFRHMISAHRDIPLAASIEADVRYDSASMTWKITYPDLGISVSNQEWDAAAAEFHDYFVFLCDNYSGKADDGLSEEEREVRDILASLTGTE